MFRSIARAAQPLKQVRSYATEAGASGGNALPYLAGGAVLIGAGYYFLGGSTPATSSSAAPPKSTFTGGEQGWVSLKLAEVESVNHNAKILRFALPNSDEVSGVFTNSAILARFKPEGKDKNVLRPYTPISPNDAIGHMDLLVKKYEGGPMSTHLHSLAVGDSVEFKGPLPKYPWEANKHDHVALIAGGTGITPMFQLTRKIFSDPNDKTKVTLIFGNVSEDDILLKAEFDKLENTYPQRFRAFYLLDKPSKEWKGETGHVSKGLLKTVLPEPKDGNLKVFVCGPPGLMNAVSGSKVSPKDQGELTGLLKDLGYSSEQVYKF